MSVFEIHTQGDSGLRIYNLQAEDEIAAKELVREREAKQAEPYRITKTATLD